MSSALERVAALASHLVPSSRGKKAVLAKKDDDVVIVSAVRTPLIRAKKGPFKDTTPEDLLAAALKAAVDRAGIDINLVEDIQVGNVLPPGGGATVARMAQLAVGFPVTSSICTLNRQCSSGLQAINNIALQIAAGQIDVGIGAGVESMTMGYGAGVMPEKFSDKILEHEPSADCLVPMGITSENVAAKYNVTRQAQDEFAAKSFQKAAAAQKAGKFDSEIVPVTVQVTDPKTGEETTVTVTKDDGIRDGVTAESLGKLKPVFSKTGSTHAGNASQVSDGAAAVLLTRRSFAKKHNLPVLGKFVCAAVVGVEPKLMGIGPAFAIPKALEKAGLTIEEVDLWEINEAFASQAVMSIEHLKIPYEKVNPVGGAIAFGHPLGATGARQYATALAEAKRSGAKVIVSSMCIGSGMGMAMPIDQHHLSAPAKTYLFGTPLKRTYAPFLHNTITKLAGAPSRSYTKYESSDMEAFMKLTQEKDFGGSAVTTCNTIIVREKNGKRTLIGHNTDFTGVQQSLLRADPAHVSSGKTRPGLIFGAGGASRASIYALVKKLNCSPIYIANRIDSEVEALIEDYRTGDFRPELIHVKTVEQAREVLPVVYIVSAVPAFPPKSEGELNARAIIRTFFDKPTKGTILEACYFPHPWTELCQIATDAGWKVVTGEQMMAWQAIEQQKFWMECSEDDLNVDEVIERLGKQLKEDGETGNEPPEA
ncbi:BZ3500_MvSof-1268-A1-R1_Chr8-2g10164 [Microbotryum saponariae]|uniref:BZ3500_MvSof-1268-A1-R1_Chr8-2g10164 protein n=1 Tax=Microbotryum saponariae TaxID=289078 RepID=A0A2X0KRB6_9BASI|nr:BZ3500_MvSof-1268-A1-R1_Chr8-2g10164 [Microbotryum saponariae]